MVVENEYKDALTHYSRACQGLSKGRPTLHNILLTSVGAWTFELILHNYEAAEMHFRSARRIVKELGHGVEDDLIVSAVRKTESHLHYQELKIAEGLLAGELPRIETLAQARRGIEVIIDDLVDWWDVGVLDRAFTELTRWRLAFDQYKFTGPEGLGQKRPVFLLHNMLLVFVELRRSPDLVIARRRLDCLLNDAEKVMESPHLEVVRKGCGMILDSIIERCEVDAECRGRAVRLRDRLVGGGPGVEV